MGVYGYAPVVRGVKVSSRRRKNERIEKKDKREGRYIRQTERKSINTP